MIIKDAIDLVPTVYTKIKNELFKSKKKQAAVVVVEPKTLLVAIIIKIFVTMSVGISNVEIEKIFNYENNGDLNENSIGVFSSNKINKFVLFEKNDAWVK